MSRLRFDFEWRLTLVTLLLLPLLLALGFWQLQRAEEKVALDESLARARGAPALPLAELLALLPREALAYRRVEVSGYFHQKALVYKDNQIRGGRYGVDVLGLFHDHPSGRWLLLNRGWLPADPARRALPEVEIPVGEHRLEASLYIPPGEAYVLGEQIDGKPRWPLVVQEPTTPDVQRALTELLGERPYVQELRLAAGQPYGFRRDWPLANSSPERHRGYALQWFTMAAVLLLLFVLRCSNVVALLRGGARERS